jgi:NDP-sugar pyrophosphorylase family protein
MKAMVLAAGLGQRLLPVTERIPKPLVQVAGRAMIEYPLLLLRHCGIQEVVINLHHLGEQIQDHLGTGERLGLKIHYSQEEKLLDTGGALLRARPFFDEETFLVVTSDVVIDLSLGAVIADHLKKRATATLVLRPDRLADRYGPIECASDGRIERFLGFQRPGGRSAPLKKLMFTGVQVLEPKIFTHMKPGEPFSLTRTTYPEMLLRGEPLYGSEFLGYWTDLGAPERIKEAEAKLEAGAVTLRYLERG